MIAIMRREDASRSQFAGVLCDDERITYSAEGCDMAWYVSLTLRWSDLRGASADAFREWCVAQPVRWNHLKLDPRSWHSTVYAIARIDAVSGLGPDDTMHAGALAVLNRLRDAGLHRSFGQLHRLEIVPHELRYYANATSVQFKPHLDEHALCTMRGEIRGLLNGVRISIDGVATQFPFDDKNKNEGNRLYGSLGKSPSEQSNNPKQQVVPLDEALRRPLTADQLILTVSDDALTNPLLEPQVDFEIISLK